MEPKKEYSVAEAAKFLGVSRAAINNKTNEEGMDRLCTEKNSKGHKVISMFELERIYPAEYKAALQRYHHGEEEEERNAMQDTPTEVWMAKLRALEEQLAYERAERAREREDFKRREERLYEERDRWHTHLQQNIRLLEDHRSDAEKKESELRALQQREEEKREKDEEREARRDRLQQEFQERQAILIEQMSKHPFLRWFGL